MPQSCDRLTTDVKFAKHLTKNASIFSGTIHLENRKITRDSARKLTRDIPSKELNSARCLLHAS